MRKNTVFFLLFWTGLAFSGPGTTSRHIIVDQFGYRPGDNKTAVIADPQAGFNAGESFTPGDLYEIRAWDTDAAVFSGAPVPWNGSKTHAQSGDRGWWFDFSSVNQEGDYYVYDVQNKTGSFRFSIRESVYSHVLKTAFKMYYFNRCGMAKEQPFADERWTDGPSFLGNKQDGMARYVHDKNNADLEKDVSGGWFDAGDFNKYVTFTEDVLHQLLDAYTQNPDAWTDDFNIPESGNGVPDLLDEIIWELEWIMKMQDPGDGGVHIKAGSITYTLGSPPSSDKAPRYYGPKCSSSSISAAGIFAHAAVVFRDFPGLSALAADLSARAILAWNWFHDNPKSENCDTGEIKAGDADRGLGEQNQMAVAAAVYLFALTAETEYGDYAVTNHRIVENLSWWGPYRVARGDALLYYASLEGAHPGTADYIKNRKTGNAGSMADFYKMNFTQDLYRAHMPDAQYHWGSNSVKANTGNINFDMLVYGLDSRNHPLYFEKALNCIHYLHGVNPLNLVYLSNVYHLGAENCVNEIYHGWFQNGTAYDNAIKSPKGPAPGYVPGGPNKSYSGTAAGIRDQPPQKAYKDWNGPENSWEITEPGIYYQSAYLKLLSKFVSHSMDSGSGRQPDPLVPETVTLFPNHPNPFNAGTRISWGVHRRSRVRVEILDIRGGRAVLLLDGTQNPGRFYADWIPEALAAGVYVCRITGEAGDGGRQTVQSAKMLYIK